MPDATDPVLTIIIVSYNVARDLRECLASIYASRFSGGLQIIVVDNASDDDTVSTVRREFPEVEVICNVNNVGFPKANNQALALARGAFILFLNPDTEVMADTLAACVAYLREHPDVGLLGCQVQYPDGTVQYECARNYPSLDAMLWEALYLHMLFPRNRIFGKTRMSYWDHQGSRDVPCLLGAFMLTRHSILDEIGGMDESVFMFMEDIDLCYRVRHAGWRVFYFADYTVIHKVGRSQKRYQGSLRSTNAEAKYAFFKKHSGRVAASACRSIFLMESIFRLAVSVLLFPVVIAFPGAKEPLRRSWAINDHWQLFRWALGYRSGPQAAQ